MVKDWHRLLRVVVEFLCLRDNQNATGYGLLKANPTLNRGDGLDDLRILSGLSNLDSVIVFPNIATLLARLSSAF